MTIYYEKLRGWGTRATVLLNDPGATVRVIVLLVELAETAEGAVSDPALVHVPCVSWLIVKSVVAMFPVVSVVPLGKVRVMVLPLARAVAGVNTAKFVTEAPTKVPTTLPDGPYEIWVMVAAKTEETAIKKKETKIKREKRVFTKKLSGGLLLSLSHWRLGF